MECKDGTECREDGCLRTETCAFMGGIVLGPMEAHELTPDRLQSWMDSRVFAAKSKAILEDILRNAEPIGPSSNGWTVHNRFIKAARDLLAASKQTP